MFLSFHFMIQARRYFVFMMLLSLKLSYSKAECLYWPSSQLVKWHRDRFRWSGVSTLADNGLSCKINFRCRSTIYLHDFGNKIPIFHMLIKKHTTYHPHSTWWNYYYYSPGLLYGFSWSTNRDISIRVRGKRRSSRVCVLLRSMSLGSSPSIHITQVPVPLSSSRLPVRFVRSRRY